MLAEASRCPSGLNATLSTALVCPRIPAPTGWPVSTFHNRTVVSTLPETTRCPSGLNATRFDRAGVAGEGVRFGCRCRRPTAGRSGRSWWRRRGARRG